MSEMQHKLPRKPLESINTNSARRLSSKILTPLKAFFSPKSPAKLPELIPSFNPPLLTVIESHNSLQIIASDHDLRRVRSGNSFNSHRRAASNALNRPVSRNSQRGGITRPMRPARSNFSLRSDYSRQEPDESRVELREDDRYIESGGIRCFWTNGFINNRYIGRFSAHHEPPQQPQHFFPGMLIYANVSAANTNPRADPNDPCIGMLRDGPVFAKARPLVVMWHTAEGMHCLPLYSLGENGRSLDYFTDSRKKEFVSITHEDDDWEGDTPWFGSLKFCVHPKRQNNFKERTYVSLGETHFVSYREHVDTEVGHLLGSSYNMLMVFHDAYQEVCKQYAFGRYREHYKYIGRYKLEGPKREEEMAEIEAMSQRMKEWQPSKDDRSLAWSLLPPLGTLSIQDDGMI